MSGFVRPTFITIDELQTVPAVSANEMREIDRLAVEVYNLGILQMMENAGRNLALHAVELMTAHPFSAVILVGPGGNGGGGLSCARHLHNHGIHVEFLLAQEITSMRPAAISQLKTLTAAGLAPKPVASATSVFERADVIIDALLGYSSSGAPLGLIADLINCSNSSGKKILALDLPSGLDATTAERPGEVIRADRTLTLALPKFGLLDLPGELFLADIGIPPELYLRLDLHIPVLFKNRYSIQLATARHSA